MPTLVVARVVAPTVYSSGVPFETVRDYLLSLPGLPDGLAAQLRDLSEDEDGTLPLPVPAELVTSSTADVDGKSATVLTSRDGLFAAVVWVEDGVMTGGRRDAQPRRGAVGRPRPPLTPLASGA